MKRRRLDSRENTRLKFSNEVETSTQFKNGELVWAKLRSSEMNFWPAMAINYKIVCMRKPKDEEAVVYWFGDHRTSLVPIKNMKKFKTYFHEQYKKMSTSLTLKPMPKLISGLNESLQVVAVRLNYNLPDNFNWLQASEVNRLMKEYKKYEEIKTNKLPSFVIKEIIKIKKLQRKLKLNDMEEDTFNSLNFSGKINELSCAYCMCCHMQINEESQKDHPLFEAHLCEICHEIIIAAASNPTDLDMCVLCTQRIEQHLVCSQKDCNLNYCKECIYFYCGQSALKKLTKKFTCFLCIDNCHSLTGLLKPKPSEARNEIMIFNNTVSHFVPPVPECKTPIRVLSLFDGISTGLYVLRKLKFLVDAYYASEVEDDAIRVSKFNFGDKIIQIGDITKLNKDYLESLLPIDLIIGGSPCTDLSKVNPARKGLLDFTGTGILFFDFYRILKEIQILQPAHHVFWLFENVASMDISSRSIISRFFNMPPVILNAKYISPQERQRFFWGNIPNLQKIADVLKHSNLSSSLNDHLTSNLNRVAAVRKLRTVTANRNSLKQGPTREDPILMDGEGDVPWVTELESIFGFKSHYTDVGDLSICRRQRLIGKSWSVPVVESIFKPLLEYFSNELDSEKN